MNKYYASIYWHFLGSPKGIDWTKIECPLDILRFGKPKSDIECLEILKSIISSKKLLARSREKLSTELSTTPFCCVTDIPIQNLHEHSAYYGRVAIGFKHKKVHQEFNPVLYFSNDYFEMPSDTESNKGFSAKDLLNVLIASPIGLPFIGIKLLGENVNAKEPIDKLYNLIKRTRFSSNPNETFYGEREWRKNGDFVFDHEDLETIIVPSELLSNIVDILESNNIRNVTVLTWDLIEKL